MASFSHSPLIFKGDLLSRKSASDLLQSSSNCIIGMPLKSLGMIRLGYRKREFMVSAFFGKGKKHEVAQTKTDPNLKGGVLRKLSSLKTLKQKPKEVTLDFEKIIKDLEKKKNNLQKKLQKKADGAGADLNEQAKALEQIKALDETFLKAYKAIYKNLSPIQRVYVARHPNRPTFLDHISNITDKFVELHGDRAGYDDPAIVAGIGTINGKRYMFIGQQKGRNSKENIKRNFGMPTPHGYRKALRFMRYADLHGFPIVTFVDTPGAFADLRSEELGQGEAIAHNLREMFGLKVPVVSIVIGEGGSGGALAIACANKLLMLENAVFYVASPEACAAILYKTAKAAPKAAQKLKITAHALCDMNIADGIIPESLGGAHKDPYWTSQQIKSAIVEAMDELSKMDTETLLKHRRLKFRKIGGGRIGLSDKKKLELRKLKERFEHEVKTNGVLGMDNLMKTLKVEIDREFSRAARALGLNDKIMKLRKEISIRNPKNQPLQPALKAKVDKLKKDFMKIVNAHPRYGILKYKFYLLQTIPELKKYYEARMKSAAIMSEIYERYRDVVRRPDIKQRIYAIKDEIEKSGASSEEELSEELKGKIMEVRKELGSELVNIVKSLGFKTSKSGLNVRRLQLKKEIDKVVEETVKSTKMKGVFRVLNKMVAKARKNPDLETKKKIKIVKRKIKKRVVEAIKKSGLIEKRNRLLAENNGEVDVGSKGSPIDVTFEELNVPSLLGEKVRAK